MQTKIWYSIENCGDGSAHPRFMESEALCNIDQEYMDEGWGEHCVGCLIVESDSPITVKDLITVEDAIREVEEYLGEDYMVEDRVQGKYPGLFKLLEGKLAALKLLREQARGPTSAVETKGA